MLCWGIQAQAARGNRLEGWRGHAPPGQTPKPVALLLPAVGDPTEVARSLAELDEPGFHHIFVKYVRVMIHAGQLFHCVPARTMAWGHHAQHWCMIFTGRPHPSSPSPNSPFPHQAVQLALDRKDRERELVSALLPTLVPSVISHGAAPRGPLAKGHAVGPAQRVVCLTGSRLCGTIPEK